MGTRRWLGLALILMAGCGGGEPAPARAPILLMAADGLEWNVLLPMVQRGELPAVRALMERGVFGHMKTLEPTVSPVIWTTIATGKEMADHGIRGFVHRGKDGLELFNSADREVKAFWNILTDSGIDSVVLGWWMTWPAERIDGLMVAQANLPVLKGHKETDRFKKGGLLEGTPGQVFPPAAEQRALAIQAQVEQDLDAILEREYGLTPGELPQPEARLLEETRWALRADETYLRLAIDRLGQGDPPAVLAVYTGGTDVVAHRFWRYAYPEEFSVPVAPDRLERFGGLLAAAYRRFDRALAKLLELLPADTTVLVVSDHGMHAAQTDGSFGPDEDMAALLSGFHVDAPPGVVIAAGARLMRPAAPPDIDALVAAELPKIASVHDITPTLLALLDVAVGEDMKGEVRSEWFDPTWLEQHPVRTVPTHETEQWSEQRQQLLMRTEDLEERLEQLRSLGYIGKDG